MGSRTSASTTNLHDHHLRLELGRRQLAMPLRRHSTCISSGKSTLPFFIGVFTMIYTIVLSGGRSSSG
ncbi:MAG: hypothetical protein ABSG53_27610 [Thermoguttaceae bacterium]